MPEKMSPIKYILIGRNKTAEFQLIYSPPHFAYSPQEVFNSVDGLSPDSDAHAPMSFDYEPVISSLFLIFSDCFTFNSLTLVQSHYRSVIQSHTLDLFSRYGNFLSFLDYRESHTSAHTISNISANFQKP